MKLNRPGETHDMQLNFTKPCIEQRLQKSKIVAKLVVFTGMWKHWTMIVADKLQLIPALK